MAGVAVHVFLTAVHNIPDDDIKYGPLPGAVADAYVNPYLVQDYRIFAPNPVSSDHNLWVRAWVETPEGERVTTDWVDVTSVELEAPHRRVLRKQLSVLSAERLMGAYRDLSDEQRAVAAENFYRGGDLQQLQETLQGAGEDNDAAVNGFISASNYATSFSTQVSQALWSEHGEVVAVQMRSVYAPVIRWEDRFDPDAEAPSQSYTDLGWRPAMEWQEQSRDGFARSFLRWAEAAGVSTDLRAGESGGSDGDGSGSEEE